MNQSCPECGDAISAHAVRCACGWQRPGSKQKARDPNHGRCTYSGADGRCRQAGTVSPHAYTQKAENEAWYCNKHFFQRQKSLNGMVTKSVGLRSVLDLHTLLMAGKKSHA